jgi:hypothetical protein
MTPFSSRALMSWKNRLPAAGDHRQVADLVDDEQREAAEVPDFLAQRTFALRSRERGDDIGE